MLINMLVLEDLEARKPFLSIICIKWTFSQESLYLLSYLASVKSTNGCCLCEVKFHLTIFKNRIPWKLSCREFSALQQPCSIEFNIWYQSRNVYLNYSLLFLHCRINLLVLRQFLNLTAGGFKHPENKKIHLLFGRITWLWVDCTTKLNKHY